MAYLARKVRSPIRPLSVAWLITLVALGAFLWCAYDSYQRFTRVTRQNLRIQELRGRIIHLDDVLTMSARMNALTGDRDWEARYRQLEPQLEAALAEVLTYSIGVQTSKHTDEANEALVQMEQKSFELTREGKLDEAKTLLLGKEYAAQKEIYSEGMDQLGRRLDEAAAAAMQAEHSRIIFQLVSGGAIILLLLIGWFVMVRIVQQAMSTRQQLDKVEQDLDIARQIQRGLLPTRLPDTPGFEIEGWSQAADQTGGDYFDWMELPDGGTLITLADVSGHGIGPALIVAVCRAYMRAAAVDTGMALEEVISRVNDLLLMDLADGRFVTAAVGVLKPAENEMLLVSAGQAPLFFYRAATRTVENWAADELPLGVAPGMSYGSARRLQFEPGDALILATDGFFEWPNHDGELFGIDRLEAFVAAHAHETPKTFIQSLHSHVVAHAAGRVQPDDITAVVVKRKAANDFPGSSAIRPTQMANT